MKTPFLLARGLRPLGIVFLAAGLILLIVRFYFGIKPDFLEVKVFAVYSAYLDTKFMSVIQNQVAEEIGGLLVLTGLMMVAFSKEKIENEKVNSVRLVSFILSAYATFIFLIFAIIFTYGLGFAFMMMMSMMVWLISYIITFRVRILRERNKQINF